MEKGYLAIVLHAHLPFVRHPEHKDSLEENWLFEAITDTYIPLLVTLDSLVEENIDFRLTVSLSPTLSSMLDDEFLKSRYLARLDKLIELGEKEVHRTASDPQGNLLAHMYHKRLQETRQTFLGSYDSNLVQAFGKQQKLGNIEIITSAATHAYLPLLAVNTSSVHSQIRIGIEHYEKAFGHGPQGFWLPECGYWPGIDEFLGQNGIRYTILETHGVTRAKDRPKHGVYAPIRCPSGLAVFGRDPESSQQVWSSSEGYPGDYDYREFYRDIAYDLDRDYVKPYIHCDGIPVDTGFKYFRITGDTDQKEIYVPEQAERKVQIHADNFVFNRTKQVEFLATTMNRKPIVVAPYDAELFGHWWFEGPQWLNCVLRNIALKQDTLRLVTLSEYLEKYPADQTAVPAASSWGYKGFSETWLNGKNDWIYPPLHQGGLDMEGLATAYPQAKGLTRRALNQAARELLMAQASDWGFMMTAGAMAEYGTQRTQMHIARLGKLKRQIEQGTIDEPWLSTVEKRNNIFPWIDYGLFSQHQQASEPQGRKVTGSYQRNPKVP
jgi:1,4-alpha-glucan branching enzyme